MHDTGIPRSIIGCILQDAGHTLPVCEKCGITPDSFPDAACRAVFTVAQALHAEFEPVNLTTISVRLERDGTLSDVGGREWLEKAVDEITTVQDAAYLAKELKSLEDERSLRDLAMLLAEGKIKVPDAIEQLQALEFGTNGSIVFPSFTIAELLAYQTDPAHYIAGRGFLKRGAGTLLTAGTGQGKSVLAMQVGLSVAAGVPILGCIEVKKPFRVCYVQAENDADVAKGHAAGILGHLDIEPDTIVEKWTMHHVYGLHGPALRRWLEATLHREPADLLILDGYQAYVPAVNLNSTEAFLEWRNEIEPVLKDQKLALLLVCHPPKPGDRSKWNPLESTYMAAGTSAISNWARASAELSTCGQDTERFRLRF